MRMEINQAFVCCLKVSDLDGCCKSYVPVGLGELGQDLAAGSTNPSNSSFSAPYFVVDNGRLL